MSDLNNKNKTSMKEMSTKAASVLMCAIMVGGGIPVSLPVMAAEPATSGNEGGTPEGGTGSQSGNGTEGGTSNGNGTSGTDGGSGATGGQDGNGSGTGNDTSGQGTSGGGTEGGSGSDSGNTNENGIVDPVTVSFDTDGKDVSVPAITVERGSTVSTLPEPKAEGFTFDGWYKTEKDDEGKTKETKVTSLKVVEDVELKAHWKEKKDSNDSGTDSGNTDNGSDSGNGSGSDSGNGSGTDSGNGSGNGSGNNGGTDSGNGSGSDSGNNGGSDSGNDSGNNGGSDSGNGSGNNGGTDSGNGSGNNGGTDSGNGSGNNGGTDSGNGSGNGSGNNGGTNSGNGSGNNGGTDSGNGSGNNGGTDSGNGSGNNGGSDSGNGSGNNGGTDSGNGSGSDSGNTNPTDDSGTTENKVNKLTLNQHELTVTLGDTLGLTYTYGPKGATNAKFVWTSSNPEVIKVNTKDDGTQSFQYVGAGKTTLTIATEDGSMKDSCEVTVNEKSQAGDTSTEDKGSTNSGSNSSSNSSNNSSNSGSNSNSNNSSNNSSSSDSNKNNSNSSNSSNSSNTNETDNTKKQYSLSVVGTDGKKITMKVYGYVTFANLIANSNFKEKLQTIDKDFDSKVSTWHAKQANVDEYEISSSRTMASILELLEKGDLLMLPVDSSGKAFGSLKFVKNSEDSYTITMSKDTNVSLRTAKEIADGKSGTSSDGKSEGKSDDSDSGESSGSGKSNSVAKSQKTADSVVLPLYGAMGSISTLLFGAFAVLRKKFRG